MKEDNEAPAGEADRGAKAVIDLPPLLLRQWWAYQTHAARHASGLRHPSLRIPLALLGTL